MPAEFEKVISTAEFEKVLLEHSNIEMTVHSRGTCAGDVCTIHKRTDHSLRGAEQIYSFKYKLMLRYCKHNTKHPDPDDINWINETTNYNHICACGCCPSKQQLTSQVIRYM